MSRFVYLLQEKEFVESEENVYKFGIKKKIGNKPVQYPKGSVVVFQQLCDYDEKLENITETLSNKFTERDDLGEGYFEGDQQEMINEIYHYVKFMHEDNDSEENSNDSEDEENSDDTEDTTNDSEEESQDDHLSVYTGDDNKLYVKFKYYHTVTTYEEWMRRNTVTSLIITNKNGEGYIRLKGQLWRKIYDRKNKFGNETLFGYIKLHKSNLVKIISPINDIVSHCEYDAMTKKTDKKYKYVPVYFNDEKIYKDAIEKCYSETVEHIKLKYHQYVFPVKHNTRYGYNPYNVCFDASKFTFDDVDHFRNDWVLEEKYLGHRAVFMKYNPDINIVDEILDSLISDETKIKYKELMYSLIVKQSDKEIIFYDQSHNLLSIWMINLLYTISGEKIYVDSYEYYDNKTEFMKQIKECKPRCVFIREYTNKKTNKKIPIKTQIDDFRKFGINHFVVYRTNQSDEMYDIDTFVNYLFDNRWRLIDMYEDETGFDFTEKYYENDIEDNKNIFYKSKSLFTNFLKWCCTK